MVFLSKQRYLIYVAGLFVLACVFSFVHDARGFVSRGVETISVGCALFWIVGVLVCELARIIRRGVTSRTEIDVMIFEAIVRAVAWFAISVITLVASWTFAARVFPSASVIYFKLNKSYIQSHWQTDAFTHLTYFPIAFHDAAPLGKTNIPIRYYELDEYHPESVRRWLTPQEQALPFPLSSRCRDDFIKVHVEENVYFVSQYAGPEDLYFTPCLISPTQKTP
jgi:hypothetical protein